MCYIPNHLDLITQDQTTYKWEHVIDPFINVLRLSSSISKEKALSDFEPEAPSMLV